MGLPLTPWPLAASWHAVPLGATESALMRNGECIGVLRDGRQMYGVPTAPTIHLYLHDLWGRCHFCGDPGYSFEGLAQIVRQFEAQAVADYARAYSD